jgi:hypothetical protein
MSKNKNLRNDLKTQAKALLDGLMFNLKQRTINTYVDDIRYSDNINSINRIIRQLTLLKDASLPLSIGTELTKSSLKGIRADNKKTLSAALRKKAKHDDKNKEYKVTMFANFKIIPQLKHKSKVTRIVPEAVDTFDFRGKHGLKRFIKRKMTEFREEYQTFGANDYYTGFVKPIQDMYYKISAVYKNDVPLVKVPMKQAFTLSRDWLKYADGVDKKAFEDMKGMCVYELLIEHLKDTWKTITKEKLFNIFEEYVMSQNSRNYLDDLPFENTFTINSGVNTDMINYLCQRKKISLYAFDGKENCFQKTIYSHVSNYKPIAYYCMDGHMYLISNSAEIKKLSSAQKTNKNVIVSSLLEMDKKEDKTVERDIIECVSFADALKHENKIVYLSQYEMTEEAYKYIALTKSLPKLKSLHHNIVQMDDTKKNLTIICDSNSNTEYTWKDVQAICKKVEIPFKNQKMALLLNDLKKMFFKPKRRVLDDDEKALLLLNQKNKCNDCKKGDLILQFDHVMPLACGGSNDFSNYQGLCSGCHMEKTKAERENSDFVKFDDTASTFNKEALKIVQSRSYKQWAFVEKLNDQKNEDNTEVYKIDHVKCRRNLIMHSTHDFPKYSVMDYPKPYDGTAIKCGEYFVKTDNYYPFRGSGFYSHVVVKRALELKIISKSDITHMFIPSYTIPNDYFKGFGQYLIDTTIGLGLSKLIVNSFVGTLGTQRSEMETIHLTLDKYEASRELIRDGVQVMAEKLNEETTIYSIIDRLKINKDDMYLPIYNQIVAMEGMELYELEQMIIRNGGKPLERNTDAILYSGKKIKVKRFFWDAEKTIKKYRYDKVTYLKREAVCRFTRTELFKPERFQWKDYNESSMNEKMFEDGTMFYNMFGDNENFKDMAQRIYDSNKGCQILGIAGGGKTTLANELIQIIATNGKKCIKLAPTRKAASHIEGQTIHKFYMGLFLSNNYEKKILKSLNNIDYMIIDEISMVKEVFYRFFVLLKRYQPNLKFIVVGDFDQLKPVKDLYQGEYINNPALFDLCDGKRINLEKCRRSDEKLFKVYKDILRGEVIDITKFRMKKLTKLNIAYTHKTRKYVNDLCIDKFGEGKEFLLSEPLKNNDKTQLTKVYEGLPIVSHKNDNKLNIYNTEVFTVNRINVDLKKFYIMLGSIELSFDIKDFQYYFYPAYCITCHVSQGCTFDEPFTIYDWSHACMDKAAKYVAVSRATSIKYVQINKFSYTKRD